MNSSDTVPTNSSTHRAVTENVGPLSSPTQATTTAIEVITTAVPSSGSESAVIAVVIVILLLTLAIFGFLLYRYLCHNKGDYRTTGELAPGEDLDEEQSSQAAASEKKEYFI